MRKIIALIAATFISGTALVCGTASAAEPLRFATANFPDNYGNPFNSVSVTYGATYSALFDPLTLATSDGALTPWLAVSWAQQTPTRWVIKLRPNIVFANGEPFTADAVVAALAYLKTDAGKRDAVSREMGMIDSAKARDPLTVEINTNVVDVMLPYALSVLRIPAPEAWKKPGFAQDPVGTGPYRLSKRTPTQATFAAAPGSWRKAPTPTMEVKVVIDPAARRTALETGRVDVVITAIAPEEIPALEALGGRVFVDKLPSVVGIALNNVKAGPLKDPRVRQALNYAVDKAAIADILWGGKTEPASQIGRPGVFGYNANVAAYPHDPAKARALLKEAGYPNGFTFDFEGVIGAVVQTDAFQKVADDLAQVGVKMNIRLIPNAKFLEYQQTGGWQGSAAAIPYASPTSDSLYAAGTQICGAAAHWFCDQGFDDLIKTARAAPTLDQRKTLTEKVMAASHDLATGIFLYNSFTLVGLGPRIANYRQDVAFVRYEEIKLKP